MRIGIISGEYPPMQGGVGAYTRILAAELANQGQQVFVFSTTAAENSDPRIHLTNTLEQWGPTSLRAIHHWADEHQLDIVNIQYQTAAYGMSPWIHFLPDTVGSHAFVTTFHDLRFPYLFPKAGGLRHRIVHHLAKASRGVIVTNHEDWEGLSDVPARQLIPIGSNILDTLPEHFTPAEWRQKAGAQEDDFLLAYFGLINSSKGLDTLLAALATLREEDIPARLVLVGDVGSSDPTNIAYTEHLTAQIMSMGLSPYIHRTGFVDELDVGAYLTASDAAVFPFLDGASYRRGSLMAAVRYGCAIVTTTPHIPVPTFVDGDNMLFVPPGDSAALAQTLRLLYKRPDIRRRLQARAAALAGEFAWEQIARSTINYFQWVIEETV
ncbi:MAG: glycosyltransferase [Anaerolineaceae bacterium]|nr:glycosyltransferase [Anaerolineaceae bacterium]